MYPWATLATPVCSPPNQNWDSCGVASMPMALPCSHIPPMPSRDGPAPARKSTHAEPCRNQHDHKQAHQAQHTPNLQHCPRVHTTKPQHPQPIACSHTMLRYTAAGGRLQCSHPNPSTSSCRCHSVPVVSLPVCLQQASQLSLLLGRHVLRHHVHVLPRHICVRHTCRAGLQQGGQPGSIIS